MGKEYNFKRLWNLLAEQKQEIISIYLYAILMGVLQLSIPLGIQAIIGFVIGGTMVTSIYILAIIVTLCVAIVGIARINQMKVIEKIQQKIFVNYAIEITDTIPKVNLDKVEEVYLPEKVNNFFDTVTLQKGFSKLLLDFPIATIQIFLGLMLLSFYHPLFIAFSFFILIILYLVLHFSGRKGLETSIYESKYKYAVVDWIEEIARVVFSFKLSQGSHFNLYKTDKNLVQYLHYRTEHFKVLIFQYKTLVFLKSIITFIMLLVGSVLLVNQKINIGEFIAAEIVIISLLSSVEKIIHNLDNIYDILTGIEKLTSLTNLQIESSGNYEYDNSVGFTIFIQNLNYVYSNQTQALNNISIQIPFNSTLCIMGNEGSGKSTLLQILAGNFKNYEGNFNINNISFSNYNISFYRSKIGVVFHDADFFKGTILENISLGRISVTEEKIKKLATEIGIENVIASLPNGLNTEIGSEGKRLSSTTLKQLQLIRALINNPQILLLEEPWLGLEEVEKQKIISYLLNKRNNCTLIVVTNDKNFSQLCNKAITLQKGEIK